MINKTQHDHHVSGEPLDHSPHMLFLAITAVALAIFAIYSLYKMRAAPAARSESRQTPSSNTKYPQGELYEAVDEPHKAQYDCERKWKKASYVHSWRTGLNKYGQTATDKMGKQLARALKTSCDEKKYYAASFNVAAPRVAIHPKSSFTIATTLDAAIIGGGECRGRRGRNEDVSIFFSPIHGKDSLLCVAVCDGHGGEGASQEVKSTLATGLEKHLQDKPLTDTVICDAFTALMEEMSYTLSKKIRDCGTTLTSAFWVNQKIYLVNVGDSRVILVKKDGRVFQLTEDANPLNPVFKNAIEKNGIGVFKHSGTLMRRKDTGYVLNILSTAGDLGIYILVPPNPKITSITLGTGDGEPEKGVLNYQEGDFIVLASDGFFNVATNRETAKAVLNMGKQKPAVIAHHLIQKALDAGSDDNASVIVWKL